MIHMGQTISPLGKLVDLLKRGDIVTHSSRRRPTASSTTVDTSCPRVLAARRLQRLVFDVGNSSSSDICVRDTVTAIMKTGFWPDTFPPPTGTQ